MKYPIILFYILFSLVAKAQDLKTSFIKSYPLKADVFYGADSFENTYYSINNVLYKATPNKTYEYNNLALGTISSVSIYNPLELVVFYRDFNSLVILDNTLNEIQKIAFLDKNISLVAKADKNRLWLYNVDVQQLELYDYKTKTVLSKSQPRSLLDPKEMHGNANYVWVKTVTGNLKIFNIYGSEVAEIKKSIDFFTVSKSGWVIFKSDENLFVKSENIKKIKLNKSLNIEHLSVVDNKLYIFNGKDIFMFKLLKN